MKRKILTAAILCMVVMLFFAGSALAVKGGYCGAVEVESVEWQLDDGVLTINGQGDMKDYSLFDNPEWAGEAITTVVIGPGVTNVGAYAFKDCDILNLAMANTVRSIGESAFENNDSLFQVVIPGSVQSIGGKAFNDCGSLATVTLEEGVESIAGNAFANTASLTKITIPASVTTIQSDCFDGSAIETIYLPDTAPANINEDAFSGMDSLTKVEYPGAPSEWKTKKDSWHIPEGVKISYGKHDYSGTCGAEGDGSNLTWVLDPDTCTLTISGTGAMKDFYASEVSSSNRGWDVPWHCDDNWLLGSIEHIVIEDGVTTIGKLAFADCRFATSVTIAGTVTSIGECAFFYCDELTSVEIPASVKTIGMLAFGKCSKLETVTLKKGLETIDTAAFHGTAFTEITIPSTVTCIESSAFELSKLKTVTLSKGITTLNSDAFSESELAEVYFTGSWAEWYEGVYASALKDYEDLTIHYKKGWEPTVDVNGFPRIYYNKNYEHVKGWKKIAGSWYFFDNDNAAMYFGWQSLEWNGKMHSYYFDTDGVMQSDCWISGGGDTWYLLGRYGDSVNYEGWKKIAGKWYYFVPTADLGYYDSNPKCGLFTDEATGKVYYLDSEDHGAMKTGWVDVEGTEMYFDKYGARANGWTKIDGKWYYFNEDGTEVKKNCWFTDPDTGKEYCFDEDGVMLTNTEKDGKTIDKYGVAK